MVKNEAKKIEKNKKVETTEQKPETKGLKDLIAQEKNKGKILKQEEVHDSDFKDTEDEDEDEVAKGYKKHIEDEEKKVEKTATIKDLIPSLLKKKDTEKKVDMPKKHQEEEEGDEEEDEGDNLEAVDERKVEHEEKAHEEEEEYEVFKHSVINISIFFLISIINRMVTFSKLLLVLYLSWKMI